MGKMNLSRRAVLKLSLLSGASVGLAACATRATEVPVATQAPAVSAATVVPEATQVSEVTVVPEVTQVSEVPEASTATVAAAVVPQLAPTADRWSSSSRSTARS